MDVRIYSFPSFDETQKLVVEQRFCEIFSKYRSGEKLAPEIIDWMDSANSWLISMESKK